MIELPNKKKCYNLPEQVAQNLLNIQYLAEQYKNIDELPNIWQSYKTVFDDDLETFGSWTTTFEGWETTLATYLANMSSAAVGAIAGQNIAPANVAATGNITANSIIENMSGYSAANISTGDGVDCNITPIFLGVCKNGNKITFVYYFTYERIGAKGLQGIAQINIPNEVGEKLYPDGNGVLSYASVYGAITSSTGAHTPMYLDKISNGSVYIRMSDNGLENGKTYKIRYEATFLLSDNLINP